MSIQELKSTIRLCVESDGNINAEIFVLLKNQEIKKANFLQVLQPEVVTMFTSVITNQLLEADYTVLNASSADERKDVVYYYDFYTSFRGASATWESTLPGNRWRWRSMGACLP